MRYKLQCAIKSLYRFLFPAGGSQGQCFLVMRLVVFAIEFKRLIECKYRVFVPPEAGECDPLVIVRFGMVLFDLQHFVEGFYCFTEHAEGAQGISFFE